MTANSSRSCNTVLVVEDDQAIRETLRDALESEGYLVATAGNGQLALDLMQTIPPPCVILLDLMMPVMGGREFLDRIALKATHAHIPVYVISAVASAASSAGTVGFIRKPADLEAVLRIVARYCGLPARPETGANPAATGP